MSAKIEPNVARKLRVRRSAITNPFGITVFGLVVEEARVVVHKAHQPDLLLDLADADPLAGKDMAEADLALADADAPALPYEAASRSYWRKEALAVRKAEPARW